jgi:hypothetical protein
VSADEVSDEFEANELWQELGYEDEDEFAADVLADLADLAGEDLGGPSGFGADQ